MDQTKFPCLEISEHYYLREIRLEDAEQYFKYINHPDVKKFVPENCLPKTISRASSDMLFLIKLLQNKNGAYWAIAKTATDEMIGTCGFETWHKQHSRLEMVYDLDPKYWNKYITQRAIKKIIGFAFYNMPVNRIEAVTKTDNPKSINVLKKLNFTREGKLRQFRHFKQNYADIYMFSLLKQEYMQKSKEDQTIKKWHQYFHAEV